MSRLIVKNLPKTINEEKLRTLFSEKGTITDIQLKYTPNGKFRQFAFIGYHNEEQANNAVNYFNNIFIQTNKITVEKCALLGDTNKPQPWSKYSLVTKKNTDIQTPKNELQQPDPTKKIDEKKQLLLKYKDDPLFEEYLEVYAPKETKNLKDLITVDEQDNKDELINDNNEENEKLADQQITDLEYMQKLKQNKVKKKNEKQPKNIVLYTLKLKNLPYNCKKKNIKDFLKPIVPFTIRIPPKIHGIAYIGFKKEKHLNKALLKNKSFILGKQISVIKYVKKEDNEDNNNVKPSRWIEQEEALKNEENIAESGKIFIRNLAYATCDKDIEELFKKFGPIADINLPIDNLTRKIKGFGTITFVMPEHAIKAYSELDGSILHGRMLHLLPGKNFDTYENNNLDESTDNYKKKKAQKQKENATNAFNWNSLFLGHDAVANIIADNFNTTKENVLNPHSDSGAAVRLALGETQIIAETRKYLEDEGVILDAFQSTNLKRSKTIILVKNLPSKTTIKELRIMFSKFGLIGRVILPPSGITAVIEFLEPFEAKKAFTNLAYSKFKNMPLYLEWAPENTLRDNSKLKIEKSEKSEKSEKDNIIEKKSENFKNKEEKEEEEVVKKEIEKGEEQEEEQEEEEEPEENTTLFVKNLNFQTTDEILKNHFECCGKIVYATVATKKDPSNPKNKLSMGYGFVRFMYKTSIEKALKTLQQSVLDGKSLELKRSERTLSNEIKSVRKSNKLTKQTGTKILIRNIPFQANSREVKELFNVFGEIKALRLPIKMGMDNKSHKGFGFVDFSSKSDAKKAFDALSQSTHLYGRRLVLEWAATEEGIDQLRKRTAHSFNAKTNIKKLKKSVFNID